MAGSLAGRALAASVFLHPFLKLETCCSAARRVIITRGKADRKGAVKYALPMQLHDAYRVFTTVFAKPGSMNVVVTSVAFKRSCFLFHQNRFFLPDNRYNFMICAAWNNEGNYETLKTSFKNSWNTFWPFWNRKKHARDLAAQRRTRF